MRNDQTDIPPNQIESYTRPNQRPEDRIQVPSSELLGDAPKVEKDSLDGLEAMNMHQRLVGHYLRELEVQGPSRKLMEKDEAFYDHDQWSAEDRAVLEARGQNVLTYNVIAQSINWILGTERRSRVDYKILPRKKGDRAAAEKKTHLLKYLADVNKSEFEISRAFEECAKVGLGWIESGLQDDSEGEPIYDRYESWRNIIYDTAAGNMDLNDGRYQFRTKWADVDNAEAMFPKRKGIIQASISSHMEWGASTDRHGDDPMDSQEELMDGNGGSYHSIEHPSATRDRVRLIEGWFKVPVMEDKIAGGEFAGDIYDPSSLGHQITVNEGFGEVRSRLTQRVYVMIFTLKGVLWMSKSPYRHNRYPFTPIWAYRKASTGMPYGVIRGMISAQEDINKRVSKALSIINSNKVIMDKGAVDDLDEFEEEVGRSDAIIVKNRGYELTIDADRELASAHLEVMHMSMGLIQTLSGVTDEAMGRTTNATSGKAIEARQNQGAMSTAKVFDNLRLARQYHGEKMLSLTEQFMTEEKEFRITDKRGKLSYVKVNDGLPDNDVVSTKADFIISEDAWSASLRQSGVAQFMELLQQVGPVAPQIVTVLLDVVVEMMDLPGGEEVVNRIRQMTGMEDPDADPDTPDPEREAREASKQAQNELQQRQVMAELGKVEGEAAQKMALAEKAKAEAEKLIKSMPDDSIETQRKALELALQILGAAPAMPVVDNVLNRSGYVSPVDEAKRLAQAEMEAAQAEVMAQAQQQQPQQPQQQPMPEEIA